MIIEAMTFDFSNALGEVAEDLSTTLSDNMPGILQILMPILFIMLIIGLVSSVFKR